MLLIGPNRSPYTRRVAIVLKVYGLPCEQRPLSGFDDRDAVRSFNPLGRIPALVLDSGETLVDSNAILDHLDELVGPERALIAGSGTERRAVLRACAILMGVCDKVLQAAYHRNHVPPDKRHQPWIDDCAAQAGAALVAIEQTLDATQPFLLFDRLTHADVAAVVAERFARGGLGLDTARQVPRLAALTKRLGVRPDFQVAEHPR
ncbi:MAG: glutathione S-transferase family protein [Enhydrobacter sp.]|nr:MAG: glutathione S-transferase family protein [Enhydrobacter sp.]